MAKQSAYLFFFVSFLSSISCFAFDTNRDVLGTGSYIDGAFDGTPNNIEEYKAACAEAKKNALQKAHAKCEKEGKVPSKLRYYNTQLEAISIASNSDCSTAGVFSFTYPVSRLEFDCE